MSAPEPTTREIAAWRRLLTCADALRADPKASCGDLAAALKVTRRSVLPCLPHTAENPFAQLHRLASRFALETARGRLDLTGELARLGGECAARLEAQPPPARRRADIDD